MKASLFLAASGAVLAMATPFNREKRKMETEIVIEWKTVTVTEGDLPSVFAAGPHHHAPFPTTVATTVATTPEPETVTVAPQPTAEASTAEASTPEVSTAEASPTEASSPTDSPIVVTTVAPDSTTEAPTTPVVDTTDVDSTPVAPPASSTQQDQANPTDYISSAVYHHNIHRLNHSAPAVEWSDTYASYAAQTAATCVFAHDLYVVSRHCFPAVVNEY